MVSVKWTKLYSAQGHVAIGSNLRGFEVTLGTICSFGVQEQGGTSPHLIEYIEIA